MGKTKLLPLFGILFGALVPQAIALAGVRECEDGVHSSDTEILEAVTQTVVILKDGTTLPVAQARFTLSRLEDMLRDNILCFSELVSFVRGTIQHLSHMTLNEMKRRGLLDPEEMVPLAVRKILRNAVPLGQRQFAMESPYLEVSEPALPKNVEAQAEPEVVLLRDHQLAPREQVEKIMRRIRVLMERDVFAAYDLVQLANNPGHRCSHPHSLKILGLLGMVKPNNTWDDTQGVYGTMDAVTRHIILNGTRGTFLDLEVVSPYAPVSEGEHLKSPAVLLETPLPAPAIRKMALDEMNAYYERAQAISTYIVEYYNTANYWMTDRTNESVSPETGQLMPNGGLALELRDGIPKYLWTPLGKLEISGPNGGDKKPDFEVIRRKLDLKEFIPRDMRSVGAYGPVYRISRDLDGGYFSDLFERRKNNELTYDEALKQWVKVRPHGRKS